MCVTRWYPRGIQKLVSIYDLPENSKLIVPSPVLIREGDAGILWVVKTQSVKSCPNFNFRGGGDSGLVKTQSAKSCPNFHFGGGGVPGPNPSLG